MVGTVEALTEFPFIFFQQVFLDLQQVLKTVEFLKVFRRFQYIRLVHNDDWDAYSFSASWNSLESDEVDFFELCRNCLCCVSRKVADDQAYKVLAEVL